MNEQPPNWQPRQVSYSLPVHKPVATWLLLGLIGLVFGLETLAGGSTQTDVLIRLGAKVTPLIAAGEYWRLFTAMFLHIGLMHLFFNAYALLVLGTEVERLFGWQRFLAIYLLSGLLGNLTSYAVSPNISAGASGAIFGLIGARGAFFTLHRQRLGSWGQRRLANIVFLIVINLFLGFTQPGIDNWAHLGGLASGFVLGWVLVPRYDLDPIQARFIVRRSLRRLWLTLALATLFFVAGTVVATRFQNDSYQSHLLRAQKAMKQEEWEQVIIELQKARAKDPSVADAILYFDLGYAYNHLDRPQLAADAYESALALEPGDSASHWNLALTYLQLQRFAEAQEQFETYLELNPKEADQVQPYLEELQRLSP